MVQGARLLTADYAFRETVATRDRGTMTSVHANHGRRIDAALMMLIDLDRTLLAETAGEPPGRRFPFLTSSTGPAIRSRPSRWSCTTASCTS